MKKIIISTLALFPSLALACGGGGGGGIPSFGFNYGIISIIYSTIQWSLTLLALMSFLTLLITTILLIFSKEEKNKRKIKLFLKISIIVFILSFAGLFLVYASTQTLCAFPSDF